MEELIAPPVDATLEARIAALGGLFGGARGRGRAAGRRGPALAPLIDDPPRGINGGARPAGRVDARRGRPGGAQAAAGVARRGPARHPRRRACSQARRRARPPTRSRSARSPSGSRRSCCGTRRPGSKRRGSSSGPRRASPASRARSSAPRPTSARGRWRSAPFAVGDLHAARGALHVRRAHARARPVGGVHVPVPRQHVPLPHHRAHRRVAIGVVPAPIARARPASRRARDLPCSASVIAPPIVGAVSEHARCGRAAARVDRDARLGRRVGHRGRCLAPPPVAAPGADGDEPPPPTYCALLCRPPQTRRSGRRAGRRGRPRLLLTEAADVGLIRMGHRPATPRRAAEDGRDGCGERARRRARSTKPRPGDYAQRARAASARPRRRVSPPGAARRASARPRPRASDERRPWMAGLLASRRDGPEPMYRAASASHSAEETTVPMRLPSATRLSVPASRVPGSIAVPLTRFGGSWFERLTNASKSCSRSPCAARPAP